MEDNQIISTGGQSENKSEMTGKIFHIEQDKNADEKPLRENKHGSETEEAQEIVGEGARQSCWHKHNRIYLGLVIFMLCMMAAGAAAAVLCAPAVLNRKLN